MAGDWIKMRGGLTEHPKVIAVARALQENRAFREWLTPGGGGHLNGQLLSDEALRCVTCALLLRVWSRAREHGEYVGDDLVLRHNCIGDLDQLAGVPGIGEAMSKVGWAKTRNGVTLPNFKEYNVPLSPAEKQKRYREKRYGALPIGGNENHENVTAREEKRREEKRRVEDGENSIPPPPSALPRGGNENVTASFAKSAEGCALAWCFALKRLKNGYPADRPDDMKPQFEELIRLGNSEEAILAAIAGERDKAEYYWQFKNRLTGGYGTNGKRPKQDNRYREPSTAPGLVQGEA